MFTLIYSYSSSFWAGGPISNNDLWFDHMQFILFLHFLRFGFHSHETLSAVPGSAAPKALSAASEVL